MHVPGHQRVETPGDPGTTRALDEEELFVVEGSKNWRSTPGQLEERETCGKTAKKPFTAAITSTAVSRVPVSVAQLECPQTAL